MSSKPKKLNYEIIERDGDGPEPYRIMDALVHAHHHHLIDANIVMAWRMGWNPDKDEKLVLGQCKKASDLDRDLHGYDIIILLNSEVWNRAGFTDAHRRALIDHELCHAAIEVDAEGEPKEDEQGRKVYRIRKHDIEEFREVVDRHGIWKGDIESFAESIMRKAAPSLFGEATYKHPATDEEAA